MPVDVLVGLQWGDEGKGKIIDILSPDYDVVARFQGGPNAGHTLVIHDKKFVFHTYDADWSTVELDYSGNAIPLFPQQLLNSRLTFSPGPLSVSASLQHVGKQYLDNTEDEDRIVNPFTVVNVVLSYRLKSKNRDQAKISFFVNNLLDAQYEASGYYDAWAGGRFYYPAAMRNYYMSLQVNI